MPTSAPQKLRNVNVFAASLFLDSFARRKKYKTMWKETKVVKNVNITILMPDTEGSNESNHTKAYSSIVASNDFNANDVTSSFDQLKVIYKKVGNNESQAFGVW